ncbi:MAG: long-chain fatty acid--CoA ligase [Solirubrobacteraceae bacterium]
MRSTMQEAPLSIGRLVRYGTTVHGGKQVRTWTGDGFRTASYGEVGGRAARLANALAGLGVRAGDRVATFMWNTQEHFEAYLAVPGMRAVLHTLNVRLHPDQIAYIAEHAGDSVILVDGALTRQLADVLPRLDAVRHVIVAGPGDRDCLRGASAQLHDYEELLGSADDAYDWPGGDEHDAAAVCYTSGTTGNPKGVVYSHRSIVLHSMASCMGDAMALSPDSRVLAIVPQFHAMAWGLPYSAMLVGAELVMPAQYLQPEPLIQMIERAEPDFAGAVPTVWQGVLAALDADPDGRERVRSLREVVVGGSACPVQMMRDFEERYDIRILHAWGMTETSPLASVAGPPRDAGPDEAWRYRATQGRFLAGVEARLVGPDGAVQPWDGAAVGELQCRGPWVTAGYHGDDHDPSSTAWMPTGDVGSITPDGYFVITDRAKDVIKSGGEWISSVDLELALMEHPDVAEAAVVAIPHQRWGERPLAVVARREGATVTAESLRGFLATSVASWQLPDDWAFVDEVPKTSVGKFDKKLLRRRHADDELPASTVR